MAKVPKEVHIVAKGKGNELAPEDGEVWGVNDIVLRRDKLSMVFHMHDMDWIRRKEGKALELIIAKATKNNVPIMTTKKYKWIPTSVAYPLDEIVEKFDSCYFGSSIDYMTAYALYKDYDIINWYGINMVIGFEYRTQKPSMEYWIGYCQGLGKKVKVHAGQYSNVLKTHDKKMYGYQLDQFKTI